MKRTAMPPRKKPMKRTGFKRGIAVKPPHAPLKAMEGIKAVGERVKACRAFMTSFRGLPSIMSGRTESEFLRNYKGVLLPTEGHHVLPKSVFPQFRVEPKNIAVLTREEHSWAEDNPSWFLTWLKANQPIQWDWCNEHRHHRKDNDQ